MSSNKGMKKKLERQYGKGCMFKNAGVEIQIDEINKVRKRKIKTYKKYKQERHYTGAKIKELEKIISVHHLKHRSEGGETTIDNCTNVNRLAHDYIHDLPREEEEIVNDMLREYKTEFNILSGEIRNGKVVQAKKIKTNYNSNDYITIKAYDNEKQKDDEER